VSVLFTPLPIRGCEKSKTYAREGTVVPEVTLVGEAVADEAELALLGVLLDGVEEIILGDLFMMQLVYGESQLGCVVVPPA
jgi:hypothetical protein